MQYQQMVGMYEAFELTRHAVVCAESVKLLLYINEKRGQQGDDFMMMLDAYTLGRINGIREERARRKAR